MPEGGSRSPAQWLVFTDLDGTLLDAHTYSAEPARPALELLAARAIPVVFCSSKTAAEQRSIRVELGLPPAPFIVENGSAIIVHEEAGLAVTDWSIVRDQAGERVRILGRPADEVRSGIRRAAKAAGLETTGYSDLSVAQVAGLTGLDPSAAERARRRDYSETLINAFSPAGWAALEAALLQEGLSCRHGGRFRTVTGIGADKGRAARLVAGFYSTAKGMPVVTAGLGDSANDESLLATVDRPYLLARPDGTWAPLQAPGLERVQQAGPHGWHAAILDLLGA
jgi:mannosyl-3-phosphoglycerate phosphatase family protein